MDTSIRMTFVAAFFVVSALLLLFGGGMTSGPMMGGGMMMRVNVDGVTWVWIPILLALSLGGVLMLGLADTKEMR